MRVVPAAMTTAWKSAMKGGDARPVVRATILVASLKKFEYDTSKAPGGNFTNERSRVGRFSSIIFGDRGPIRELRNIKSFTWTRSVDQDVATATLVLSNTDLSPIGVADEQDPNGEFDQPGMFTYNRGAEEVSADRWGYSVDKGWHDIIVPDRLVRTYEGYGHDPDVMPGLDPNLMQSGTWLIDKVTLSATTGDLTIEMRDVGRMLLDQIVFPPVIPYAEYPLYWSKIRSENVPGRDVTGGAWEIPVGVATSSNELYVGEGLTNPPLDEYVSSNGGVEGHHAKHVLREGDNMLWLSTGQADPKDKVFWEVDLTDNTTAMNGVRIKPSGGPYRIYISLQRNDGTWIGRRKIPYSVSTGDVDLNAGVPFIKSVWADRGKTFDVTLPRKYGDIQKVRLTFTHLHDSRVGVYPWRAGLNDFKIYKGASKAALGFTDGEVLTAVGNYSDYSHIIKWLCAWGGFYWPPENSGMAFIHVAGDTNVPIEYAHPDNVLPKGRVWGNFMKTGTAGVADLTIDLFDKKPLMDGINYVRDIVGFVFFIDEAGSVVWRMPNVWTLGNYVVPGPLESTRARTRTTNMVTIDERETMLDYSTTLDSADIRERIFVANSTGKFGIVIRGFNPYKVGFRRIAGWTDQRFESKAEARVMADLLAAQSMHNYKRSRVVIPGYPAIQIDDQVQLWERVTNETYVHYVGTITSSFEAATGDWTYTLETHWLGENPSTNWVVKVEELEGVTQAYLNLIGEDDPD